MSSKKPDGTTDFQDSNSDNNREQHKALELPGRDLAKFLNGIAPDSKCSFCQIGEYQIISAPTGEGIAGVVATPVPNVQHLGVWFFIASCKTCGHSAFFNAPIILDEMTKGA